MRVLPNPEREALKRSGDAKDYDFARYHRFLEDVYGYQKQMACVGSSFELPDDIEPSLEEYRAWLRKYDGWSYGPLTPTRRQVWKPEFANPEPPMNKFYDTKWRRSRGLERR